jgi:hypothetical protein
MYSETSVNHPALGPMKLASSERWLVLWDFLCKEIFGRDLKNWPMFRKGRFSEGWVLRSFTVVELSHFSSMFWIDIRILWNQLLALDWKIPNFLESLPSAFFIYLHQLIPVGWVCIKRVPTLCNQLLSHL